MSKSMQSTPYVPTDELCATSDEQHRLRKMIRGSTGTKDQDAMDEVFDNAIGENATIIDLEFNENKLNLIFNNGTPMTRDDRGRFVKLDTRCKKVIGAVTPKKRKGMHGIGEALSRGRLAGQGKQTTTTKTEDGICHQIVIDLKGLTAEDYNQSACWSMDHEDEDKNLRPKWKKIDEAINHEKYKTGVTKEYSGEALEQKFELNDTVFHLANKYARNIKLGLKITIKWDSKKYVVPLIYNDQWDKKTYTLNVFTDLIEFNMDTNRQTVHITDNGTWRNSKVGSSSNVKNTGESLGTLTFTLQSPKKCNTCPKGNENAVMDWFNECLSGAFTNDISEHDGKLYLNCGDNEVSKDLIEVQGRTNHLTATLLDFNKGLSISMDNMKLATNNFDIGLALKSKTLGGQFAGQAFRLDINFTSDQEIIKPQENKNVITIPSEVTKALNTIVKYETERLNKVIKEQRDTRDNFEEEAAKTPAKALWDKGAPARKKAQRKKMKEAKKQFAKDEEDGAKAANKKTNPGETKVDTSDNQKVATSTKTVNSKDKSTTVATFNRGFVTKTQFQALVEIYLRNFEEDKVPAPGPYNQMQKDLPKQ